MLAIHSQNPDIQALMTELLWQLGQTFSSQVAAVYQLGSLARGGFSDALSDIDVAVVFTALQPEVSWKLSAIQTRVQQQFPQQRNPLSIFWGSVDSINGLQPGGRFPAIDRLDLINNGVLLAGRDVRCQLNRPAHGLLVTECAAFAVKYLNQQRLSLVRAAREGRLPGVLPGHRQLSKLVLFPARFIALADGVAVCSNPGSVEHFCHHYQSGQEAAGQLLQLALAQRQQPDIRINDDYRSALTVGLAALYRHFFERYRQLMADAGEFHLCEALRQLQQQIWKNN